MSEIRFEDVTFSYFKTGDPATLNHLTASFDSSRVTLLTGSSGCGKSTFLSLAAGIYPQYAGFLRGGRVTVDGTDPAEPAPNRRCRLVGVMFQNPDMQFCMDTVRNELIFCLENIGTPAGEVEGRLRQALDFCGIASLKDRRLLTLSGGEKQKVALACLIALRPAWILLDEPFAGIDDRAARSIVRQLCRLRRQYGAGILAVDHRPELWQGAADDIRELTPDGSIRSLAGFPPVRRYQSVRPEKPGRHDVLLQLRGVCMEYGGRPVLQNVRADFRRGLIYAILGASGAGKSSLFGALSGLKRYAGDIRLDGADIRSRRALRRKIGFVFQSPQDQFVSDTVYGEISASLKHCGTADGAVAEQAEKILRGIRLWPYRDFSPYMLSQGQQRRLGVAALLAYRCEILICDEPTYAQDWENTRRIMEALQKLVVERGLTLIFSTHDGRMARDYADCVEVLENGALYERDEPQL